MPGLQNRWTTFSDFTPEVGPDSNSLTVADAFAFVENKVRTVSFSITHAGTLGDL